MFSESAFSGPHVISFIYMEIDFDLFIRQLVLLLIFNSL